MSDAKRDETTGVRGSLTRRLPPWRRLGWRLAALVLGLTALGILASGLLQYRAQARALERALGERLLGMARTGALLVDPALHLEVQIERRADADAYRHLQRTLAAIQDANQLDTPLLTLADYEPEARRARFVVASGGPARPGDPYDLVPALIPSFEQAFRRGAATRTAVYQNQHGRWITAFAPLKGPDGQTIAMLAADYRADVYLAELGTARRQLYLHSAAGALLAALAGLVLARRITRPVEALAAVARRVVEGDFFARPRVGTRDEVGLLANVFHLMVERLQVSHRSMVDVLVRALEARGGEPGSLRRLASAAAAMAEPLALTPAQREALELGALLHDAGEIRTPEALLAKPGPLTPDERRAIEQHPVHGVELLETVPLLSPALDVVGAHHERWDGTGYPGGLREEAIPLAARIFAVVDTLDAMTHDRPHRPACTVAEALTAVKEGAGTRFDPRVVEAAALALPPERWAALLGVTA